MFEISICESTVTKIFSFLIKLCEIVGKKKSCQFSSGIIFLHFFCSHEIPKAMPLQKFQSVQVSVRFWQMPSIVSFWVGTVGVWDSINGHCKNAMTLKGLFKQDWKTIQYCWGCGEFFSKNSPLHCHVNSSWIHGMKEQHHPAERWLCKSIFISKNYRGFLKQSHGELLSHFFYWSNRNIENNISHNRLILNTAVVIPDWPRDHILVEFGILKIDSSGGQAKVDRVLGYFVDMQWSCSLMVSTQ